MDDDPEGDEVEREVELAAWKVRVGLRYNPTQTERQEHNATHIRFGEWCTHRMMGRGRTHHHTSKHRSEDHSRRPTIAVEDLFMEQNSATHIQTISDESVTGIAVKEDRHASCAVWFGRKASKSFGQLSFVDQLGYREITLKSDTEPAVVDTI